MFCDAYPKRRHPWGKPQGVTMQLILDNIDICGVNAPVKAN